MEIVLTRVFFSIMCKRLGKCKGLRIEPSVDKSKAIIPTVVAIEKHFQQFGKVDLIFRSINGAHGYVIFGTNRVTKLAYSAPEHVIEGCVVDVFRANHLKQPKTYGLENIRTFFLSFDSFSCRY